MSILKVIGLLSVALFLALSALVRLCEGKSDSFASIRRFLRRPPVEVLLVLACVCGLIQHGATKNLLGSPRTTPPRMQPTELVTASEPPGTADGLLSHPPIPDSSFDLGLVLVGVGTNEVHDFAPPASAMVVGDWLAHGAATDWIMCGMGALEWRMPFGTNGFDAMRIFANGEVWPFASVAGGAPPPAPRPSFSVLHSPFGLGVVPVANWRLLDPANLPCQVWHGPVDDDTFAVTWQNVLLGRVPENPVSFQVRFKSNGDVVYRYDLSKAAGGVENGEGRAGAFSNVVVGVANGGAAWRLGRIPTNLTSLVFARLTEADRDNPDRDGDGVSTVDELFVHHTDPSLPDTDFDGLSDHEELFVRHSDPFDPYSLRTDVPDGMAAVMGSEDPFACPPGSTNTIFEHVLYTGTTNAPFAFPSDTDGGAVLKVTAWGSGSGRLVVGDRVVPLLAGGAGGTNTLCVPVPRGVRLGCWGSLPQSLQVEVDSDSYAIGRLPAWHTSGRGWIAFPNTKAKEPCIHDLGTRGVDVSLDPGPQIAGLVCTWNGTADIEAENRPPLAARLTGLFPRRATTPVTYTLDHPDHLFGDATFVQTARFCPALSPDDEDDGWTPGTPVDAEYGDGAQAYYCSCAWGGPCSGLWCECGCLCGGGWDDVDGDDEASLCPEHDCPHEQCEHLHRAAYTSALGLAEATNVLRLDRSPADEDPVEVDVPDTFARCCPCPDHWTNYVALAAKSYNLAVRTEGGERFTRTCEDGTVYVSGLAPSLDFDDSAVSLCRTGVVYETRRYTVLGLGIDSPHLDIAKLNEANPGFGLPVVACTNRARGAVLRLRTDVDLPDGSVHIGFSSPAPGFRLYLGHPADGGGLLVDSAAGDSFDVSVRQWRRLLRNWTGGREVCVTVVAEHEGAADLVFGFAAEHGGQLVGDVVRQRLTAIRSPLMADYNHDGAIDEADREQFRSGHPFRFWSNLDRIKADAVPVPLPVVGGIAEWLLPEPYNADDFVVNGTYDLLNLFPVALDLSALTERWGNAGVSFAVCGGDGGTSLKFTFADIAWNALRAAQTNDVLAVDGAHLREAPLRSLGAVDVPLDASVLGRFGAMSGVMLAESAWSETGSIELKAYMDGREVFRSQLPFRTSHVRDMYRWINARHLSGGAEVRATDVSLPDNAPHGVENMKKLIFLHGANVAEADAEFWGEQLFKRLWHTGCAVDFYNVDWRSDIGSGANYHQNASNAFAVAARLAPTLAAIPGEKVIMAHSLGNMVVSSMMQDWGLTNSIREYIVCNSAVPSEAYADADDISMRVPQLVHPDWESYPTNSWASNWHRLFKNDAGDDRKHLGWPARFLDVRPYITSVFYSKGDEILEMYVTNSISILSGVANSLGNLAWHKQELFKGRGVLNGLGGTTWAGWNIDENIFGVNKISVEEAVAMDINDPSSFKTNTVFYCYPESMNRPTIPLLVRGAHLAMGIPALAPSVGWTGLLNVLDNEDVIDENVIGVNAKIPRPNDWPVRSNYQKRWLHSDMKDVSYYFNFMFYEKVKEKGGF